MTNLPEPIPVSVLQAKEAIYSAWTSPTGGLRALHADILDALMELRDETIRELTHEAVACPECDKREQERLDYVGRP